MKQTATTIDLLRHGQTEGGEIFRGSTDLPLTGQGWQQMQQALQEQAGWQRIISSPLRRCADFAEWLAAHHGISQYKQPGLQEICFGDWEGKLFADVYAQYGEQLKQFWRDPVRHTPPNAESMTAFCQRVKTSLWQGVEEHRGEHLLLVTHGGVIRAILADILGSDISSLMRYDVPYASWSRVRIYHDDGSDWPQLVFFNR